MDTSEMAGWPLTDPLQASCLPSVYPLQPPVPASWTLTAVTLLPPGPVDRRKPRAACPGQLSCFGVQAFLTVSLMAGHLSDLERTWDVRKGEHTPLQNMR